MSQRDRDRLNLVREIMGMDNRNASLVIEYMDRNNLNPEWSQIEGRELKIHLRKVFSKMSVDRVTPVKARSLFTTTDDDPFYRPWQKEIPVSDQTSETNIVDTSEFGALFDMSDEEFEKWAASLVEES